ncbi:alpha/beta hydrolase [Rhizohabitans arisaemae]|uniref:alpha/beta hydrolase n=1 Tax=Rhizohabitans arisaemae TaxID=2720610 RepID=UPI0024B0B518|nr:alpha/beta hydrolase [Rhizohabitans arisaemae]
MTRRVGALGAVVVSAVLTLSVGPAHAATGKPAIDWKPCAGEKTAECGTVRVPIDWAKPNGPAFDLAVARRKAGDPARRIGVLFVDPGGGPVSEYIQRGAADYFSPEILARFDLVGVDPRGVGSSNPVRCSTDLMRKDPWPPTPGSQAEFDRMAAYYAEVAADCRRRTGPVIDHLDSRTVARDLDAVRVALGERTISYHGVSAGTAVGQRYAELFGRNLRAMSLDSNVDRSLDTEGLLVGGAKNVEDSFRTFVRWCDRETACALHGRNVPRVWDEVLDRADRGELRDPNEAGRVLKTFEVLSEAHLGGFMGPDFSWLAKRLSALATGKPGPEAPRRGLPPDAPETMEHPAPAACQDLRTTIPNHRRFARLVERARRAAPHMRTHPDLQPGILTCALWPDKANTPQRPLKVRESPRLLLINARHDPATGHDGAVNVRRQLGRKAVLVTYEGAGHGVYHRTSCTRNAVDRYLLHLRVPADGTRCPAATDR